MADRDIQAALTVAEMKRKQPLDHFFVIEFRVMPDGGWRPFKTYHTPEDAERNAEWERHFYGDTHEYRVRKYQRVDE